MKRVNSYIMLLVALAFAVTACDKQDPDFFDDSANGVYFDYENAADFSNTVNFADYILGNPSSVQVDIKIRLLGYLSDDARKVSIKTKPVGDFPEAVVEVPDVSFYGNEYEKSVAISVARPAERNTLYAVCVYIDGDEPGALGSGVEGRGEYIIYVKEQYEQPSTWYEYSLFDMYWGDWSPEKHIFFVNLTGDNNYATSIGSYDWETVARYNEQAVALLRSQYAQNQQPVTIDIPFSTDCNYEQPPYWSADYDEYLGAYSSSLFCKLAGQLGANTSNEHQLLAADSEQEFKELNKQAALLMMKEYNNYFTWAQSVTYFMFNCWFPMFEDIDYDVVQPICWSADGMGGGEKPNQYYGEYSDEKYKFMIKTLLKKRSEEGATFMLWEMFPLMADYGSMTAIWDRTAGGESLMRSCYQIFKEAYDAQPAGTYEFTFPELNN